MDRLKFHVQDLPQMAEAGARFVVVAYCGEWRDGMATNYQAQIPRLQRELRKRFMNRIDTRPATLAAGTGPVRHRPSA